MPADTRTNERLEKTVLEPTGISSPKVRKRLFKRGLFIASYLVFLVVLLEGSSRLYLKIEHGVKFLAPEEVLYVYYPELYSVSSTDISRDDEYYDVLLLGGSVLEFSDVAQVLQDELSKRVGSQVRIHNVAKAAHTSRDSYLKYVRLGDKTFDLVVPYHAINEVRANNCPASVFRNDYSHYSWYAMVNSLDTSREKARFSFPFVARMVAAVFREKLGLVQYVPTNQPLDQWMDFGAEVKTNATLRTHFRSIIDIAASRGDPLVLSTFGYQVPGDEDLLRVMSKEDPAICPTELWGHPDNVFKTLVDHNREIVKLHEEFPTLLFADQERQMPKDDEHFIDACHLTKKGSARFVDNLVEVALRKKI